MDKAKLTGIAPILVVKNVVETAEFYRDVLGFTINGYFNDPPVYAMVGRDSFEVHFGKADGPAIQSNVEVRKLSPDFVIWVPEIDKFFEEVTSRNADIVQGIVPRPYGREFIIRDCDGHQILVVD